MCAFIVRCNQDKRRQEGSTVLCSGRHPQTIIFTLGRAGPSADVVSQDREDILYELVVGCFCSIAKRMASVKMHTSILVFCHLLGTYLYLHDKKEFFQRGEIACHKVIWQEWPKYSLDLQAH